MLYRRFGRTELRMPVFTCGGMRYQQAWTANARITPQNQANLEATIDRALALGIDHIETARGYGTSEAQLGVALARHPRDSFKLQTKVAPTADPSVFERNLAESFARLKVDRVDLFAFHGLNTREYATWTVRPGGCFEVAERLRRQGKIGAIGFSTHAPCPLIEELIATDRFDYVNLHYYFILKDNLPAVRAARRHDMGVFIISPNDKGGRLYDPTPTLVELCRPLSPMAFNDLWCLAHDEIHTLSIGAARPTDFDVHVTALEQLAQARALLPPIVERLEARLHERLGEAWATDWQRGIPEWDALPGGVNAKLIVWIWNLAKAFDMIEFGRSRYSWMTGNDHWVPGAKAGGMDETAMLAALAEAPHRQRIIEVLRDAHALFS